MRDYLADLAGFTWYWYCLLAGAEGILNRFM